MTCGTTGIIELVLLVQLVVKQIQALIIVLVSRFAVTPSPLDNISVDGPVSMLSAIEQNGSLQ